MSKSSDCHCERSEAISVVRAASVSERDCFVAPLLAMTLTGPWVHYRAMSKSSDCHCERSEAISVVRAASVSERDCFVAPLLAMTLTGPWVHYMARRNQQIERVEADWWVDGLRLTGP